MGFFILFPLTPTLSPPKAGRPPGEREIVAGWVFYLV